MSRSKPNGQTVAVTGAAGYIGRRLVERLCESESVTRVLGFDVVESPLSHSKYVFDRLDVRDKALESRLKGVDRLVHLAFVMDPIKDEAEMRDINVNGSQNVFRCAGRAGVARVIYSSTALVYGAHPDNDFPLTEESPLRANLDFSYSAHKLEVEYIVREVAEEFPSLRFTIFRPAIVFGPKADNAWSRMLEFPILLGVTGYRPPFQFVHEDDVARALEFAVFNDLDGAYNLAAEGWIEADEILRIARRRRVDVPEPALFSLLDRLWSLGLFEAPAGIVHYLMHPWVLSSEKLRAAGFECRHGNEETLGETAGRAREHVRLGRTRVKRNDLVRGAAVAGAIGAVAALRALQKRRAA